LLRVVLNLTVALLVPTAVFAANPVGVFEAVGADGVVSGWSQDPDTPSTAIDVHIYMDHPAGQGGIFVTAITAGYPRQDVGAHGFRYMLAPIAWDGQPHTFYVYGIDTDGVGAHNVLLSGSPISATLVSTRVFVSNGALTVGIEPRCGGTIVSVVLSGSSNFVNNGDCTGRQVQAALYDGAGSYDLCAGCTGVWGWDPVQGGDRYFSGSVLTGSSFTPTSAYTSTRAYQWNPADKGGGPGQPVQSDVTIEQWVTFVDGLPNAAKVHVKLTHLGTDSHLLSGQEFPAVYVNIGWDTFVTYNGVAPWTNAPTASFAPVPSGHIYSPERWAAYVNASNAGLAIYVPSQYPWLIGQQFAGSGGEFGQGANYFAPFVPMAVMPGAIWDGDYYVLAGDVAAARASIYALHTALGSPDVLGPYGFLDVPANGQTVSGTINVAGWAMDDTAISAIRVFADGVDKGAATYGSSRPDIPAVFPHAPSNTGFVYSLNTTLLANGPHTIEVRATDPSAHSTALLRKKTVLVDNGHAPCGSEALIAGVTPIRAQHVTELRGCIAAARTGYSLPSFVYSNPTIIAGTTVVTAVDITEMRTALAEVYTAAILSPPIYTDPGLGPGMVPKAAHILELRSAVDTFR
jgi:hypothetical protein